MLGREHHERGPEQRVGPGREHAQLLATGVMGGRRGLEHDLGARGAPDPVGLHDPDRVGPVDAAEVQQLVGVVGDPQVPLRQLALLDLRAAAPAVAIRALDLLARERAVVGAPVDRRHRAIREPGLEELEEQPLVPAVVLGVARDELGVPVPRGPHRPQLASHRVDVGHRPLARVHPVLDRRVLGGQPEAIEAHRLEDVVPAHAPVAADRIGRRLHVPVTDVQRARRVVEHRQQVEAGLRAVGQVGPVQAELLPAGLPARLDGGRVVALDPATSVADAGCAGRAVACRRHGSLPWHERNPPPVPARGLVGRRCVRVLVELRGFEPLTF